jgi:probable F420-dependent oxidoreductase
VQVLPGRNPLLVAKEWATLDRLSNGRVLPAFGLGVVDPREQQAFGVARSERAAWFDEALPLVRRLWTEASVDHDGARYHLVAASVSPKPVQQPPDVWLGGIAPSELRRVGRLGDGWLPSFCTPDDVRTGRKVVEEVAAAHDREIDTEHFGALVAYSAGPVPDLVAAAIRQRRPDVDPADLIPDSLTALRARIESFIEAGASKFVVVPLAEPADWDTDLEAVASVLKPLEN